MQRNTAINLALAVLVLILALIAYFEPGKSGPAEKVTLTPFTPEEINYIRISDRRGRNLVMERSVKGWMMKSPYEGVANEERIRQLLGITMTRSFSRFTPEEGRLAEYGLDPAPIQLQLNELKLEIGGNEPIQYRRYVRIGDQIHLISNGYHHHLMAQAEVFLMDAAQSTQ